MSKSDQTLRLGFADFWPGFDPEHNFFTSLLSRRHCIELSDDPDLLVYSVYGTDHTSSKCKRLMISFENRGWGFSDCDFAITSDLLDHPDHYRLPLWSIWTESDSDPPSYRLVQSATALADTVSTPERDFASIVVSNSGGASRNRVQSLLELYRPVASGGRHRNNVDGPVSDKIEFLAKYKFNIAFENSSHPGYTTEKLLEALQANTVPIYWGNPHVGLDFNHLRFVSRHDFASDEAMVRRVIELDQDDAAYAAMLAEPWFTDGVSPACASRRLLADWLDRIIADGRTPIAQRRSPLVAARRLQDRRRRRRRYLDRVT